MMSAHGWHGVFAIDAEAHGDGPECLQDCLTQEFQWSRSMMNILLGVSAGHWAGLSRRAKLRLGFCRAVVSALRAADAAGGRAAARGRAHPDAHHAMQVPLGAFYVHVAPAIAVLVATVLWLRSLDCLRPRAAKAVSWEMVLFQLVRWPWALLGCIHAVAARVGCREVAFKVTPKGRSGVLPLPAKLVAPYLAVATVSAAPTLLDVDAGAADGYRTLTLINTAMYLCAAIAIVALHVHEHPSGKRRAALWSIAPKVVATAACAAMLLVGLGLQGLGTRSV